MKIQSFVLTLLVLVSQFSYAGSQKHTKPNFEAEQIITFSKQVEQLAAKKGARAFIIGRVGQAPEALPKGIQFTHTAVAVYSQIKLDSGEVAKGYAIYNLYQDAKNKKRSDLVIDYPVDFFWGVHDLKAGIIIPSPELQADLIEAISLDVHKVVHNPKYSVIANPNNNKYQNCTEHTLNLINAAIYDTIDMKLIKQSVVEHFEPQRLKVSGFKLALGGLFTDDIRTSDHKGKVKTATFTTIAKYLDQFELMADAFVVDQYGEASPLI